MIRVPKMYRNAAQAIIDTFWFRAIEKQGRPALSKAQIRQQIERMVIVKTEEDGTPDDSWIVCDHCEGEGLYTKEDRLNANGTVADQERGLCYQCYGKGMQSPADQKRNHGYQWHRNEREVAYG